MDASLFSAPSLSRFLGFDEGEEGKGEPAEDDKELTATEEEDDEERQEEKGEGEEGRSETEDEEKRDEDKKEAEEAEKEAKGKGSDRCMTPLLSHSGREKPAGNEEGTGEEEEEEGAKVGIVESEICVAR